MADDLKFRLSFRANGGIGSIVRLLRDDVDPAVQVWMERRGRNPGRKTAILLSCNLHYPPQTAATAALSLLASRDIVVQDSVRYEQEGGDEQPEKRG